VEKLVGSFTRFAIAVVGWPLVFGIVSNGLRISFDKDWGMRDHLINAYSTFFGLQPANLPKEVDAQVLTVLIMFTGFIHLGIFIAHLYTLISRR
jgi:hypothetical protein